MANTGAPLGPLYARYDSSGALVGYFDAKGNEFSAGGSSGGGGGVGLAAARPAATSDLAGYIYYSTDTAIAEICNGVSYVQLAARVSAEDGIPAYTWATRPAATTVGQIIRITDLGNRVNVLAIADGTVWQPLGGQQTIYALAAPITGVAGASSACTLPSITVPGGLMGTNGGLEIIIHTHTLSAVASVANTVSYTFGGFELFGTDRTTNRRIWNARVIMNRASAAVQTVMANASGTGAYEQAANDPKETTKDTTADVAMAGSATATHATSIQNRVDEFRVRWIGG